jgi:hypothetical protein
LESYYARKGNTLTDLSEQQLVDCNTVNAGCNGGDPYQAFYYEKINGAEPYSAYPVSIYVIFKIKILKGLKNCINNSILLCNKLANTTLAKRL